MSTVEFYRDSMDRLLIEREVIKEQRDELLAALEFIMAPQPYAATQEYRDNIAKAREMARAAIAKARGK